MRATSPCGRRERARLNEADKAVTRRGLINRRRVRSFLLDYAARNRAHRFTRVADAALDQVEAAVREKCRQIVNSQPSKGRTIK